MNRTIVFLNQNISKKETEINDVKISYDMKSRYFVVYCNDVPVFVKEVEKYTTWKISYKKPEIPCVEQIIIPERKNELLLEFLGVTRGFRSGKISSYNNIEKKYYIKKYIINESVCKVFSLTSGKKIGYCSTSVNNDEFIEIINAQDVVYPRTVIKQILKGFGFSYQELKRIRVR